MVEIKYENGKYGTFAGGVAWGQIVAAEGAEDRFEQIEPGAWRWHRHTDKPVDHMRMELLFYGEPTFTMVPSVSYNGNG